MVTTKKKNYPNLCMDWSEEGSQHKLNFCTQQQLHWTVYWQPFTTVRFNILWRCHILHFFVVSSCARYHHSMCLSLSPPPRLWLSHKLTILECFRFRRFAQRETDILGWVGFAAAHVNLSPTRWHSSLLLGLEIMKNKSNGLYITRYRMSIYLKRPIPKRK